MSWQQQPCRNLQALHYRNSTKQSELQTAHRSKLNMHLLPSTRGRWINYSQRTLSILWVFNDRLPPQRICLAYERRLLQLQEDGPQAADVLGVFGVLGVELAQSGDFLPRLAWHLLVTVLDECFLRRPESTSRKLGNRSHIICNSNSSKQIKWTLYLSSYSQALGFSRQPSKCILSTSALEFFLDGFLWVFYLYVSNNIPENVLDPIQKHYG